MHNIKTMMSSEKADWRTPENLLALIRKFAGGRIALDPCTSPDNPCSAVQFFTQVENGLKQDWSGPGTAFMNPPYSRALRAWAAKCAEEGKRREIVGLVPSRTDTRWWQESIVKATAICFWKGRLKFVGAAAGAPFPSALPYWGSRPYEFREVFGKYGWIVDLTS